MSKQLEAHLFVCTNQKADGGCCASKDAMRLRDKVKKLAQTPDWIGRVRVNASGCLGHCEEGIVAVLYPEGKWFTKLTKDSSEELITAIKESIK